MLQMQRQNDGKLEADRAARDRLTYRRVGNGRDRSRLVQNYFVYVTIRSKRRASQGRDRRSWLRSERVYRQASELLNK